MNPKIKSLFSLQNILSRSDSVDRKIWTEEGTETNVAATLFGYPLVARSVTKSRTRKV
jgi:hypothetical protein